MKPPAALGSALIILVAATAGARTTSVKIAVPDMPVSGADPGLGKVLTEILTTEVSQLRGVSVIGSSDISAMIGFEKQKDLLGCQDNVSCIAEIGGALGVDMLLVSSLGLVGQTYVINLKLIDTHHVGVLKRIYKTISGQPDLLIEGVRASLPELMAAVVSDGDEKKPTVAEAPSKVATPQPKPAATTTNPAVAPNPAKPRAAASLPPAEQKSLSQPSPLTTGHHWLDLELHGLALGSFGPQGGDPERNQWGDAKLERHGALVPGSFAAVAAGPRWGGGLRIGVRIPDWHQVFVQFDMMREKWQARAKMDGIAQLVELEKPEAWFALMRLQAGYRFSYPVASWLEPFVQLGLGYHVYQYRDLSTPGYGPDGTTTLRPDQSRFSVMPSLGTRLRAGDRFFTTLSYLVDLNSKEISSNSFVVGFGGLLL